MKNMNMKKLNKFIATMLIISMIFTSGGMASFASVELGDAEPLETSSFINEEESVGEATSFPEEESNVGEAISFPEEESNAEEPEETNVGEATSFPDEDAEELEEDIVEEEEGIAVEEQSEEEESIGEFESTAEEEIEESSVENATTEIATESEVEHDEETEENEEVLQESIEAAAEETAVKDDIFNSPGGGGGGRVKFNDSLQQIKGRDYTLEGRTEITKVTTTKVVTAPTVTIASSESSKLTFRYWYDEEKNIKFNSGESKALGDNAPSGILTDGDPYRYFTPVFNDTRPIMTIQVKNEYLGKVFFGYNKRDYGFYEEDDNYSVKRKLALNSADYEGLKAGLSINAGYAFYRIVNSSGNEVDPTQWNRSSNVTYYLELKDNKKKVYYRDSKFNSTFSKQEDEVYDGLEYTLPTLVSLAYNATNEGQDFLGWENTTTHEFVEAGASITFSGDEDVVYEAVYSDKKYLYYVLKGYGDSIDRVELEEGEKLVKPTDPTSPSHNFKGWYHDYDLTQPVNFSSDVMGKINKSIYAKWEEKEFAITLNTNNGVYADGYTAPTKRKYSEGATLPTSANISRVGYTFGGWYKDSQFNDGPYTSIPQNQTSASMFYLKWNDKEYNISYNLNGGSFATGFTAPIKRKYSETTTLPNANQVLKTGYTFAGWYANSDFSGSAATSVAANTGEDKNYYAKWTPRQYNVIYHEDGGVYRSGYTKVTKRNYDEAVTLPTSTDITKDGGTFIGWYDNDKFTGDIITNIPAYTDKDVHVYVKWNEAMFTITYNENGGTYKEGYTKKTERRYSDPVYLPQNGDIIKKGYIFAGWYENSDFTGSKLTSIPAKTNRDVVLYAKWVDGVYTITYNENGGTYVNGYQKITERKYTDEVKLPTKENIIKEGFDLEGWYESPEFRGSALTKIPANTDTNKVLYAKWKGKQFNVTLNTNGGKIHYGNVKKYSHSIGAILPTAVIPPDEHKKFVGWYENENLTGVKVERIDPSSLGDKVYYAKYNPVYLLKFNAGGGIGTMSNIQVDYGKSVNIPNNSFVKEGYKFKNWISDKGKTYEANKSITLNADTVLTAEWEIIDNSNPSSGGSSDPGSGDSGSGGSSDSGSGNSGSGNSGSGNSGSGNSGSGNSGSGNSGSGNSGSGNSGSGNSGSGSSGSGSSSGKSSGKTGGNTGGNTGGGTSGGSGGNGGGSGGGVGNSGSASSGGPGSVSAGGEATPNTNNESSASNESGDTVPNIPTGPNSTFNVTTENSVTESRPKSNISSDILKQIEDGTAKPGMYYAWEGQAPKWKARDIVTNDYVKNTFIYAEYAGKVRKYFFNELGEMAVGWINYNGYIYYMNPTEGINYGDMVTGVQYVDGKLCEFLPSGEFYRVIYQM